MVLRHNVLLSYVNGYVNIVLGVKSFRQTKEISSGPEKSQTTVRGVVRLFWYF